MTTSEPLATGGLVSPVALGLTSCVVVSPARTSPTPGAAPVFVESGPVSGLTWPTPFAFYDPDTSSWRTSQQSLFEDLTSSPETWPRSGMTSNGTAYLLPPSAPLTAATGGGELLPTPTATNTKAVHLRSGGRPPRTYLPTPRASDADKGGRGDLLAVVRTGMPSGRKHWPTPTASDGMGGPGSQGRQGGENLRTAAGGALNPTFVEWLMGFPPGWTDLEPSETP
jgi:hypothetical protein